jgi:hypothetical protein
MIPYEPCDERAERSRLDGQWKEVVVVELLLSG